MRRIGITIATGAALLVAPGVAEASFPGQEGEIAFSRQTGPNQTTLWRLSPASGRVRALTEIPRRCGRRAYWADYEPSYSSDGRTIAYVHEDSCSPRFVDGIYLMRADGRNERFFIGSRDRHDWLRWPAFQAAGDWIGFVRQNVQTMESALWASVADRGDEPLRWLTGGSLLFAPYQDDPEWSARGELAVSADGIYAITEKGLTRRVTRNMGDYAPSWHPSGRSLVFERLYSQGGNRPDLGTIYSVRPGSPPRRLLPGRSAGKPVWSPAGGQIAYVHAPSGLATPGTLMMMSMPGGRPRPLVSHVNAERVAWQPRPR